jgi:hypothetical protein
MTTGLIFIDVSVMQMLRGSMVIFSALLTIFVRKRKLRGFEWFGVLTCAVALCFVGGSSIAGQAGKGRWSEWYWQLLGCLLVLLSQVIQATQIIIEEFLLADVRLPPLVVVGLEGFWGSIMCLVCFIPLFYYCPGPDHGHWEDTYDTVYKLGHDSTIAYATIVYFVSILFLNWGGMIVTSELTAVHRTIFEAFRTLFIWLTSLVIRYGITPDYGEDWTNWSYMEAGGFLLLVFSMLTYNQVVRLVCCFAYPTATSGATTGAPEPEKVETFDEDEPARRPDWIQEKDAMHPLLTGVNTSQPKQYSA